MELFEAASREKLRFKVSNGVVSAEDLWEYSLTTLDDIGMNIQKKLKETSGESLIPTRTIVDKTDVLRLDIIKHIITVKLIENERKKAAKERAEKRAELKELIGKKIRSAQEEKSIEQLQDELAELDEY
jgi:uncharacterized Zn finger protein